MQTAGRFVPEQLAREIHDYLITRPALEVLDMVLALRATQPVRPPKPVKEPQ